MAGTIGITHLSAELLDVVVSDLSILEASSLFIVFSGPSSSIPG
jgi:hypothetical protein